MENFNLINFKELTLSEQTSINGGLVCGGLCMFALGVAVGMMITGPYMATR